jgi:hypothetical protein
MSSKSTRKIIIGGALFNAIRVAGQGIDDFTPRAGGTFGKKPSQARLSA